MKNYQVTIAGEESFYLLLSDAEYKAVLLFITACNNRNIVEIKISPVEQCHIDLHIFNSGRVSVVFRVVCVWCVSAPARFSSIEHEQTALHSLWSF